MKYHRFKPKYMEKEDFDTCIFYFNKDEYIFRLIQDKTVQEKNFKKKVRETIKTYESQIKEMICQLEGL